MIPALGPNEIPKRAALELAGLVCKFYVVVFSVLVDTLTAQYIALKIMQLNGQRMK